MAKEKKGTQPEAPADKKAALKVTCRKESFIRAGIHWTKEPKTVLVESLTGGRVAALKAEPMLIVEEVEV
jgi:hypothetical protein